MLSPSITLGAKVFKLRVPNPDVTIFPLTSEAALPDNDKDPAPAVTFTPPAIVAAFPESVKAATFGVSTAPVFSVTDLPDRVKLPTPAVRFTPAAIVELLPDKQRFEQYLKICSSKMRY